MTRQGELRRIPHHSRDRVPLLKRDPDELGANPTGGTEDSELHRDLPKLYFHTSHI